MINLFDVDTGKAIRKIELALPAGTATVNAAGAKSAEANQELFIFKKDADGAWKIARYSFSTTNPPPRQQ